MTAAHTPGPWEISANAAGALDVCAPGAGDMLADLAGCQNAEANARLIAAAPELLAALQDVALRCTQARIASTIGKKKDRSDFLRGELERIAQHAEAVIAKARGNA